MSKKDLSHIFVWVTQKHCIHQHTIIIVITWPYKLFLFPILEIKIQSSNKKEDQRQLNGQEPTGKGLFDPL